MDGFDGFFDVLDAEQVDQPAARPGAADMITYRRAVGRRPGLADHGDLRRGTAAGGPAGGVHRAHRAPGRAGLRADRGGARRFGDPGGPLLGTATSAAHCPGSRSGSATAAIPPSRAEIAIRGRNLFSGYWPDGRDGLTPRAGSRTGDIGYLLDGELFLVDRSRELIIVNGFNVYPAEVEEAVAELDGVESVAVLGQSGPAYGGAGGRLRHRARAHGRGGRGPLRGDGWPSSSDPA